MRFMIIRKADPQTEAWAKPSRELVDAMMAYNEAMIRAGVMLGGDGLKPSSRGHRIKFSKGKPKVTDGRARSWWPATRSSRSARGTRRWSG
jgi:hypothetical protein